jgi:VanZ family protein
MARTDVGRDRTPRVLGVGLWCAAWACVAAAIVLSLAPSSTDPATPGDKLAHLSGYAVMALCFLTAAVWAPRRGRGPIPDRPGKVVGAVMGFSFCLELLQPLVGRTADVADAAANSLGAALGWALWAWLRRRLEKRSPGPG